MSIRRLFQIMFGTFFLVLIALGVLSVLLFINEDHLLKSQEIRYESYKLADLLRQSSDDLTRFARTYAVTGDRKYEQYYWDILAIREGAKPLPAHYDRIYWDFMAATGIPPRPAQQSLPLYQRLKNVGVTSDEFAKLLEAEAKSNALVKTEEAAMNAVKGRYDDGTGEFTKHGEPNQAWAIKILYDNAYHREKAKIMQPIDEFFAMLDARTFGATEKYKRISRLYLNLIIGLLVLLFFLTLTAFAIISAKVNSSFAAFGQFFQRAAKGASRIDPGRVHFTEFQEMAEAANQMVDERQKAEAALRDSTERLNLTLAATGIGIWERDLTHNTLIWDKATQAILGFTAAELSDYREVLLDCVHPDDLARIRAETRQALEGTADYNTEFRVVWPDASLHVVAARAVVLRTATGTATRMIGACWDITDNKQREQLALLGSAVGDAMTSLQPIQARLQRSCEALVHQLDAALARIWIVNAAGDLLEMQASAGIHTQTDGTRSRIPMGQYKIGRIAQEARPRFSNQVGEEPDVDDKDWVRQNGLVSFVGYPLIVEDRVVGVMAFFARTKLNPHTVHALAGIAKTIAVTIDRDRAERELELAREAAEVATRAKSAFLANMSHELRTPMNAILGYSEMLMEEAEDQEQEDFIPDLQKIHTAGKHLLGLINEILDLSKIEAGKMELFLETFDVAGMINDVASTLKPLVEKNANTLAVHCAVDIGTMHADLTKTRQSLFNLLSNACKFTQNGTITLEAEAMNRDGTTWMAFRVADSGIGMTPEQIDKLFQPFVQADVSTSRKYGGTGLGMTITQHFTRMMGGEISVASKPGTGTTFTILLPAQIEIQPQTVGPQGEAGEPKFPAGANTVLVIEDDPGARDLLRRFLGKEGFRVETANRGEDGLRLARELHPDVITLDVMMPGMDGWAVLSELKADPDLADIPVVMVTIVDNKNLGYALGAVDYLTKPIQRDRLLAILEKYCQSPQPATVLVVEDDAETREILRRLLEKTGVTVKEAENGRVALDRLAEGQPGLILLDLMMPEMDGFQFVDQVRQHAAWSAIPIVVVTAKSLTDDDRQRLNGYVAEIIQKDGKAQEELLADIGKMVKARLNKSMIRAGKTVA
jgi:PAS domain S-box-containing protein